MDDLDALIDGTREAGVDVVFTAAAPVTPLPPLIELNAYRDRAGGPHQRRQARRSGQCDGWLAYDETQLKITVRDDGRCSPGGSVVRGHGITGMLERARILGGTLEAGRCRPGIRGRRPAPRIDHAADERLPLRAPA